MPITKTTRSPALAVGNKRRMVSGHCGNLEFGGNAAALALQGLAQK